MKLMVGRRHSVLITVTATVMVALSACSDPSLSLDRESQEAPSGPASELPEEPRAAARTELPLDSYQPDADQMFKLLQAQTKAAVDCARQFGVESTLVADPQPVADNSRRYGVVDLAHAQAFGYNAPDEELIETPWNPSPVEYAVMFGQAQITGPLTLEDRTRIENGTHDAELPEELEGVELMEGGCIGEAHRLIPQLPVDGLDLLNQISAESSSRAEQDDRVVRAIGAWSECMADRGYLYDSIWEPNDTSWPDPAGAEEVATAVADVDCKVATGLLDTWVAVESEYQRDLIEENAETLDTLQTTMEDALRAASEVLEGSG